MLRSRQSSGMKDGVFMVVIGVVVPVVVDVVGLSSLIKVSKVGFGRFGIW